MADSEPEPSGVSQQASSDELRRRQLVVEYAAEIAHCAQEQASRLEDWVLLVIAADDSVGRLLVEHYRLARDSVRRRDFYLVPKPYEEVAAWFSLGAACETFRTSLPPGVTAGGHRVHLAVIAFEGVSLLEVDL